MSAVEEVPMIDLRRAGERHHDHRRRQEMWRTFYPKERASSSPDGFGTLELFNEVRLPPGADVPRRARHGAEVITYVREGSLRHASADGTVVVVEAGEFHRFSEGRSVRHVEKNASRTEWAHVFQIWLRPAEGASETTQEQKRFSTAQRRGALCLVASPDARIGSLRLRQDAQVYSAILDAGQHVVHEIGAGRSAWIHVIEGEVTLGDLGLVTGDGAGFTGERAVSLTALRGTEILLLDLGEQLAFSHERGGVA